MHGAALYTAAAIFVAVAIVHLVRYVLAVEIVVDGAVVALWWSPVAAIVLALLGLWMIVAARRS